MKKWFYKLFTLLLMLGIVLTFIGGIAGYALYIHLEAKLPDVESLRNVKYQVPLRIYTADHLLMAEYGKERRVPLLYEHIPQTMIDAILSSEDDRFFEHPGVDYHGILRAIAELALTGKKKQGGSTITMQVARNFFLSNEKTYTRKLNEILLAFKIEASYSKEEILALYLNKIYLGNRAYGIGAAAQVYYGKEIGDLNLPQLAMLAGLPKAPSASNPLARPKKAKNRRNYVLRRMHQLHKITDEQFKRAKKAPITAKLYRANIEFHAPYLAEMARDFVEKKYGDPTDKNKIYTQGYNVTITVNSHLQKTAENAFRAGLDAYDMRHGYRGAEQKNIDLDEESIAQVLKQTATIGYLIPAVVTEISDKQKEVIVQLKNQQITLKWDGLKWARKYISELRYGYVPKKPSDILQVGDLIRVKSIVNEKGENNWRLAQKPQVAGAFVSLDPKDGKIKALVGGYSYFQSKFNRVIQAKRQAGSGFKPYIYSAALEKGYTAASMINDAPVVFHDVSLESEWRPENYSGKFFGPTRLRYALTKSRNLISIRLLRAIGINFALEHTRNFGFDPDELPHNLSLSLGSANISPIQQARGYAVLANGGYLIDPYFVSEISEINKGVIYQAEPKIACTKCTALEDQNHQQDPDSPYAPRTITRGNRFIMYSMMQDVIKRGTATKARVLKRADLAGKTGTTNKQVDAWFNGYNQSIVGIAWVGFDDSRPLGRGEVGGRAALPIWIEFMREALKTIPDIPPTMPEGMIRVLIDPNTGLLAKAGQKNAIFEIFRAGHQPVRHTDLDTDSEHLIFTADGLPADSDDDLF